ncbi:MAG: signal peptidase II [Phycisphaerae bacterium]
MSPGTVPSTEGGGREARSAIRDAASHGRLWLVCGTAVALDLWSKHWVFAHLGPRDTLHVIPGVLDLQRTLNAGAVFGALAGFSGLFVVATIFALGAALFIFSGCSARHRSTHVALGLILGGALGNLYDRAVSVADVVTLAPRRGTGERVDIGTVVDRTPIQTKLVDWPDGDNPRTYASPRVLSVERKGVVRDFIRFVPKFPGWVPKFGGRDIWPWVFNVADAVLVCGVAILVSQIWFDRRPRRSAATSDPLPPAPA